MCTHLIAKLGTQRQSQPVVSALYPGKGLQGRRTLAGHKTAKEVKDRVSRLGRKSREAQSLSRRKGVGGGSC